MLARMVTLSRITLANSVEMEPTSIQPLRSAKTVRVIALHVLVNTVAITVSLVTVSTLNTFAKNVCKAFTSSQRISRAEYAQMAVQTAPTRRVA